MNKKQIIGLAGLFAATLIGVATYRTLSPGNESVDDAVRNAMAALERRDAKALFRYASDEELQQLELDQAKFEEVLGKYVFPALEGSSLLPERPESGGVRMASASQKVRWEDGRYSYVTFQAYETEKGPRIRPLLTNLVLASLAVRKKDSKYEPFSTWALAAERDRDTLGRAGMPRLYGAFGGDYRTLTVDEFGAFARQAVETSRAAAAKRAQAE